MTRPSVTATSWASPVRSMTPARYSACCWLPMPWRAGMAGWAGEAAATRAAVAVDIRAVVVTLVEVLPAALWAGSSLDVAVADGVAAAIPAEGIRVAADDTRTPRRQALRRS